MYYYITTLTLIPLVDRFDVSLMSETRLPPIRRVWTYTDPKTLRIGMYYYLWSLCLCKSQEKHVLCIPCILFIFNYCCYPWCVSFPFLLLFFLLYQYVLFILPLLSITYFIIFFFCWVKCYKSSLLYVIFSKKRLHTPVGDLKFLVFHHTDTHIQVLSLALALSIHNKQSGDVALDSFCPHYSRWFIHYHLLRFCQTTLLKYINSHILLGNRSVLSQLHVDFQNCWHRLCARSGLSGN